MTDSFQQHLLGISHSGTIIISSGAGDSNKLAKTYIDGKFHPSLIDLSSLSANIDSHHVIFPESIIFSDDGSDNFVVIIREFDYTNKKLFIRAQGNANDQDVDLITGFIAPPTINNFLDPAIVVYTRSSSGTVAESTSDIELFKNGVSIHTAANKGTNPSWTSYNVTQAEIGSVSPGDEYYFIIKAKVDNSHYVDINRVVFRFNITTV